MLLNASKQHKNLQYPAQSGPYKVFVKDKSIWKDFSVARLQISVGNPKHEGDKFFALTEWAAARFDQVILIVSDTLQRHNIAADTGISLEHAHGVSLMAGQRWLKDNQRAIDNIAESRRVITLWDDWMSRPAYAETLKTIHMLYNSSPAVRAVVDEKALLFCRRQDAAGGARPEISVAYILEEVAAFAVMFAETRAIDIYPGSWFKEVFDVIVNTGAATGLLASFGDFSCLSVDFTRNKSASANCNLIISG